MTIESPIGNLAYLDQGTGDLPLIFIHGLGCAKEQWHYQIDHFSTSHRCIAIDLSGHGESDARNDDRFDVESAAEEVGYVIDALDLESCALIGHSFGGPVALTYNQMDASKVRGIFLVDPAADLRTASRKTIDTFLGALGYDFVPAATAYWKNLLGNAQSEVVTMTLEDMKKVDHRTFIDHLRSLLDFDPITALEQCTCPLGCVMSPFNRVTGTLTDVFPALPTERWENVSHWLQLDEPERLNAVLEQFLEQVT